jgi:hypothetical protein
MLLRQKAELQSQQPAAKNFKNNAAVCQYRRTTCSRASKKQNFQEDVLRWRTTLCAGVIETQRSFAKASSRARETFLDV